MLRLRKQKHSRGATSSTLTPPMVGNQTGKDIHMTLMSKDIDIHPARWVCPIITPIIRYVSLCLNFQLGLGSTRHVFSGDLVVAKHQLFG